MNCRKCGAEMTRSTYPPYTYWCQNGHLQRGRQPMVFAVILAVIVVVLAILW
jgi:hypothetical protein